MPTAQQEQDAREFIESISELGPIIQARELRGFLRADLGRIHTVAVQRWYVATWPRYEAACKAIGRDPMDRTFPE